MERFAGRVAVVTGASSGIGAAVAEDLVRAGMQVVGVARRLERLQDLADKLRAEGALGKLHPQKADVSIENDIIRVYRWIDENLGGVSIVLNNAAIYNPTAVQDSEPGAFQTVIDTNFVGVMNSCREALVSMKKHDIRDGHIINMNSVAGHTVINPLSIVSVSTYCATKFAITAFSKALRRDVKLMDGFKIRVTSISPGVVDTEIISDEFRAQLNAEKKTILTAQTVSNAVLYALASPPDVEITELTLQSTGEIL